MQPLIPKSIGRSASPSLIKWTGSKRLQASRIAEYVPTHRRYFEPFLGGGALLYYIAAPGAIVGDIYQPLIDIWKLVQNEPETLINNYSLQWELLQQNTPQYYYNVRRRFNNAPNPLDLNFLTRTCVNGIVRFNQSNEFNNSFHLSRPGMRPQSFSKIVWDWHIVIRDVEFICQDYADTLSHAVSGDFVYLDPPYAGNKMRYTSDLNLQKFFAELESLNRRHVKWILSFDGTRGNTDLSHEIPRELYKTRLLIPSGNSALGKVLNGRIEKVHESLYINY